ncbi:hypothetical protein C8R43DRAFT_975056 [Mycena crocata]|nr:hypothetical protein C8R43DRAFT_975056 [Mycena crocata]
MPSPSPSARDRSAVSTPPARRSASPPRGQYYAYDMSRGYPGGYVYGPPPQHTPYPDGRARYEQHPHPQYAPAPYPVPHGGYVPYPLPGTVLSAPPPSTQPPSSVEIVHTDDAATKLSDRVRRRCFNCCTTDTSTWRRSNLSPGKVLCNKCGLFERTHSRPRPDQFPHKRGPLASANLGSRSPKAVVSSFLCRCIPSC